MILDASALLAYLKQERGWQEVELLLPIACILKVNWTEVVQKLHKYGIDDKTICANLELVGVRFLLFTKNHADNAAELWQLTSPFGLSLGDRACLATGLIENMPVVTADSIWKQVPLDLDIRLIR